MSIESFILIGGRSTRLNRDKAFVNVGGRTLAERALTTVRESKVAAKTTFVAGNSEQFAIEAMTLDAPFIFDLVENRGPLGGLHAALSYAQTEWIFLIACDYPFVSPELIKLLADARSDDFGAVVPIQPDGRMQPLCAFYNIKFARSIVDEIIHAPRVPPPMRDIVKALNPRLVSASEYSHLIGSDQFFANLNTQRDLNEIRKLASG